MSTAEFPPAPQMNSIPSLSFENEHGPSQFSMRYGNFRSSPSWRTLLELFFKVEERGSSVKQEIYGGALAFVTVASILAVNPSLLVTAGYDKHGVVSATALFAGISCIATGLLSNLPFIMMPVLATSLYLSVFMSQHGLTVGQGNMAVFFLGIVLSACSWRPISSLLTKIIPKSTNAGIYIGVGLLCSLQGLSRVGLVQTNSSSHSALQLGNIWTPEACITLFCYLITGCLLHKKVKASIMLGLLMGSVLFWGYFDQWPTSVFSKLTLGFEFDTNRVKKVLPSAENDFEGVPSSHWPVVMLTIDLFFIVIVLFSGLTGGMARCAGLARKDGSTPRSRLLYLACGIGTLLGAFFGSGPILLSGESIVGIQAGARSGLSTVVCGVLFLVSSLMTSFWANIPETGISTVLLVVGFLFFDHTSAVDWKNTKEALPTFTTCIFTAFTCSVLNGAVIGTILYALLALATDYTDSITEVVIKATFRCWNWLRGGFNDREEDVDIASEDVSKNNEMQQELPRSGVSNHSEPRTSYYQAT